MSRFGCLVSVLIASVLVASTAEAQRVYNLPAGQYLITGEVRAVGPVISPDGPAPTPTPDPTPDALTARAKAIKMAAEKAISDPNREQTATQLAELYRQIAVKVQDKAIVGQELIAMGVKFGTDHLLTGKGSAVMAAWKPMRDVFSVQWAEVLNKGGDDSAYVALLTETADGLQASAPNAEPQIDIAMIMAIIKMILEILALFS